MLSLPLSLLCACTVATPEQLAEQAKQAEQTEQAKQPEPAKTPEAPATTPEPPKPSGPAVPPGREDLVATDLPAPRSLDALTLERTRAGSFKFASATDEIAPRAALSLGESLALVGQAYFERRPGNPLQSWRWWGVAPAGATETLASNTRATGAIRAAIPNGEGGALLAGTVGPTGNGRGWIGSIDASGNLGLDVELDSQSLTEMLDLLPGRADDPEEHAVALGYLDAQGWVLSLDAKGQVRWQKFVSSSGYTQIRAAARLDSGDMLALGTVAKEFGDAWSALLPRDGGPDPSPAGVEQGVISIEGADKNQMLQVLVDIGEGGFVGLGTAKRNHIQAHAQLIAVGFDREGKTNWSRALPEVRAVSILGASGAGGRARFVLEVPDAAGASALAILELRAGGEHSAKQLADSAGWSSAGFVEGAAKPQVLSYRPSTEGIEWVAYALP